MSKPKALLIGDLEYVEKQWASLADIAELMKAKSRNRNDFLQEAKSGSFEGVVVVYLAANAGKITGAFNAEVVSAMPSTLKFLCHNAAGYDSINIEALSKRQIRIGNVQGATDSATADTALFLLLGALRNFNPALLALREGRFQGNTDRGNDPNDKILGILGMGGIGRSLAKKVIPLGIKLQYHNRGKLSDELSGGAKYVSFDELLATSDIISIHLPLNENTRHIISKAEFAKMKDSVIIINTSRGAIIDEVELVKALDSGKIRSAGLDVYEEEPKVHPGLMSNPKVILLPHCGTQTIETKEAMELYTLGNVRMALEMGTLQAVVPEQAGKTFGLDK